MAESEDVCINGDDFHSVQIHLKLDSALLDYLLSCGVKNVAPNTSEQDNVSECSNRTIMESSLSVVSSTFNFVLINW